MAVLLISFMAGPLRNGARIDGEMALTIATHCHPFPLFSHRIFNELLANKWKLKKFGMIFLCFSVRVQ